ncbi:MAG: hypothetical protein AAB736_02390, partial [Patescibacteria group bacterium]
MQIIKIRWKSGLVLFIFLILSGLYFFGIPDFYGILDYKYAYYNEEVIGFFSRVILPAPFLVGIFLLSLYKTEKRIKEGKFSFWKLLVFGLMVSLVGEFFWTLQFIGGLGYGHNSLDVITPLFFSFLGPPMALAFLFLFVPPLLLHKFYSNQKKFYIATASFFVLLFFGLFIYQQAAVKTCVFNTDGLCLGKVAIKANNPSLCDKARGNNAKNGCLHAIERNKIEKTEGTENYTRIGIDGIRYYEGYIKNIYIKSGTDKNFIDVDLVQWLEGEEGQKAITQDTGCTEDCLPNNYYIRNRSDKITTLEISPSAVFK